ncbi:MAG: phospholipase [Bacteroidetes bacterium]|nr:phospholipase [Bacteroidota bacterium]
MTPKEHHIKSVRTARLYTLGSFEGKGKHLWIATHGYASLARDFITCFEPIVDDRTLVVAPEGLSRFYTKGFAGGVGASWMTKEDREFEIYDYVEYLDRIAEGIIERMEAPPARITAFGFSQGCPTITRWTALGSVQPDEVVLWCGDTPTDLDFEGYTEKMKDRTTYLAIGSSDEVIAKPVNDLSIKLIADKGLATTRFDFEGGHAIPSAALVAFKAQLLAKK